MKTWSREALAYAAGLFEGEGSIDANHGRGPALRIGMTDLEPLEQFIAALGMGHVLGPYPASHHGKKPIYRVCIASAEQAQAALAMMWPWLGPRRRAKAREYLPLPPLLRARGCYDQRHHRTPSGGCWTCRKRRQKERADA